MGGEMTTPHTGTTAWFTTAHSNNLYTSGAIKVNFVNATSH